LQLRGHALPHPDAHVAYWCAVCTAARSENREPNAGIGRIKSFSFSAERADELAETVRQSTGRSIGRIAAAQRRRTARQSVARRREHAARKFLPRARRVQRILSPGAGREGIGLSSPSLIARRYRREHWLLSSPRTTSISSSASSGTQATEVGYGSRNQ
jgi:hypothetical protein